MGLMSAGIVYDLAIVIAAYVWAFTGIKNVSLRL